MAVESSRAEFTAPEPASSAPEPAEPIANVRQQKHAATLLRDLNGKLFVEINGEQHLSGTEFNDFVVRNHVLKQHWMICNVRCIHRGVREWRQLRRQSNPARRQLHNFFPNRRS